jgi:hypothetical protein
MSLYYINGTKVLILHEGTDYFSFFNFCSSFPPIVALLHQHLLSAKDEDALPRAIHGTALKVVED